MPWPHRDERSLAPATLPRQPPNQLTSVQLPREGLQQSEGLASLVARPCPPKALTEALAFLEAGPSSELPWHDWTAVWRAATTLGPHVA
eukprot:479373-Amphidinium_carterae.1